ncbi:HAMP domain-containing histidine kinase [bacterium]|nr:HAMP domain-containing histidine kinase [bacterium]
MPPFRSRLPSFGIFRRIRQRLIVTYVLLTVLMVSVIGTLFYYIARDALDEEMGRRLVMVAQIGAARLDAEAVASLRPSDEESEAYKRVVQTLKSLLDLGAASRIYIIGPDNRSLADTDPSVRIGTEYYRFAAQSFEIDTAASGIPVDSAVFRGRDGAWYKSAFAPIRRGGEVAGVVGVDADVTFFAVLRRITRNLFIFASFAVAMIVLVSLLLAIGFERPIQRLVHAAQRLAEGDLHAKIEPTSRDEIGFLATSLETARQRIVERDRNLQMLQRGIAHEVRNPLGGMRLFCDILSDELAGDEEKRAHVDKIRREISGLERVVNEFLDFTRELPLDPVPVVVGEFLTDLLDRYRGAEATGVKLAVEIDESVRRAVFDPALVRRALFNLINNAIQAMAGGGRLTIRARRDGPAIAIDVADNGAGIKPEVMEHLFTPFYTTKDKGTGLGMPFTRKIVERHGGTMHVESEAGRGTTVTIRLPQER